MKCKRGRHNALQILVISTMPIVAGAQGFTSGSNGSFGPIDVVSGIQTIVVPSDGIINATTVGVASGARLLFDCNERNTPVYLLATGDVTIDGTVTVSAPPPNTLSLSTSPGGCGGFAGGAPRLAEAPAGDGLGPGGGGAGDGTTNNPAGSGAYSSRSQVAGRPHGAVYGSNLLVPLVGGSGGGGALNQGGGGGGAILIASTTSVSVSGRVLACGGSHSLFNPTYGHAGSAGAIRIVAPRVVGNGALFANGASNLSLALSTGCNDGPAAGNDNRSAGEGRIRVDTTDRSGIQLSLFSPAFVVGALMEVFPSGVPELHIVDIAGTAIPVGSGPVNVLLPSGTPTQQPVTIRGIGFIGDVPIRLVLTPESGSRVVVDATLAMNGAGSADVVVNVDVPENINMNVAAWVRDN